MKKVLIVQALFPESYPFPAGYECILPVQGAFSHEELLERIGDCDALLSFFNAPVNRELIAAGHRLKIISNVGVGFNNIDVAFATERGIAVANTPDPVVEPTAELAFTLLSDLVRGVSCTDRRVRAGQERWGAMENLSHSLYGKVLGLVGFGRIGQATARRAVAAGMQVVYYSRHRVTVDIEHRYGARYLPFPALLAVADVVSLHTPYTSETHHLMDEKAFSCMKPTAYLVNTARGAVVDESALIAALQSHRVAGAGLDVFEQEPQIPAALRVMENVLLSPHTGTATREARNEMAGFACRNVLHFFAGEPFSRVN